MPSAADGQPRRGFARRLRDTAILVVASLALLEFVLQAASLVVAIVGPTSRAGGDGARRVVLCVGDSFTYGLGASSFEAGAYPAQLQRLLDRAAPGAWRVVNAGFPGRNSRQALERSDGQLARERPEFVCVLIGLNDRWSHPEPLDLGTTPSARIDDDRAWRFEVRTWRLWLLIRNQFRDETTAAPGREHDDLPLWTGDDATAPPPPDPTISRDDPKLALREAVRTYWRSGVRARLDAELRAISGLDPTDLNALLEELRAPRALRENVAAAFAAAFGWRQADGIWLKPSTGEQRAFVTIGEMNVGVEALRAFQVHREHVAQIAERCRASGATPVLIGYPNRTSFPDEYLADVAKRAGMEFHSTVTRFEARLAQEPAAALFVADGHCNDVGYALLAQVVRDALLER
ncbi:MAG: hypothetical protein HZB39_08780 [Planctomycetes bacterium]|nr:hypothetical protein [Planctomycetota bacterium]